ncbi:MAG: type II toxin-antitoxin system RelE/ParE family toxin [Devosiaceae bacterium]|nr:type II toxin-antitoxin system RelE/ParE family toxin [Devosiaceae bacterium]
MSSKKLEVWITPTAKIKLKEIYNYSCRKWGKTTAKAYMSSLQATILKVANGEKTTQISPNFSTRFSYCVCKSHYIFFQVEKDRLIVATAFHTQMSVKERLDEEVGVIKNEIREQDIS